MKNFKQVMILENVVENIFCNMCGEPISQNEFGHFAEHLSVNKVWGYNSDFDCSEHSFDICQKCYADLISQMKIKP